MSSLIALWLLCIYLFLTGEVGSFLFTVNGFCFFWRIFILILMQIRPFNWWEIIPCKYVSLITGRIKGGGLYEAPCHYSWKNDLHVSHVHPTYPRRLAFFWFSPQTLIIPKLLLYLWEFWLAAQHIICGNPAVGLVFRDSLPVPGSSAISNEPTLSGALRPALPSAAPLSSILGSYTFHGRIPVERFRTKNWILNMAEP